MFNTSFYGVFKPSPAPLVPPNLFSALAPFTGLPPTDGLNAMYSANGTSWTSGTTPAPVDGVWADVCWSPELNKGVAVSAGNNSGGAKQVVTSIDGINWTTQVMPVGGQGIFWQMVCWSADLGIFCACSSGSSNSGGGSTDRIATSPDGITWTIQTCPAVDRSWKGICWSPELSLFVVVAETGGAGDRVMTSPDGVNWTLQDFGFTRDWQAVDWSPTLGLFCAVSLSGRVGTSPDGVNWTLSALIGPDFWVDVIWVDYLGLFIASNFLGSPNNISTSPDGTTWTPRNTGTMSGVIQMTTNGTIVVGVTSGGTDRVITSPDGITWTPNSGQASNRPWSAVCWAG